MKIVKRIFDAYFIDNGNGMSIEVMNLIVCHKRILRQSLDQTHHIDIDRDPNTVTELNLLWQFQQKIKIVSKFMVVVFVANR